MAKCDGNRVEEWFRPSLERGRDWQNKRQGLTTKNHLEQDQGIANHQKFIQI